MDFKLHYKMPFGDFTQIYETTGNDMTDCTIGAICTIITYNIEGEYNFIA